MSHCWLFIKLWTPLEAHLSRNMVQRDLLCVTCCVTTAFTQASATCYFCVWVRSRNWGCFVTWFCYQLIAKPGNKTASVPWPDPYILLYQWFFKGNCSKQSRAAQQNKGQGDAWSLQQWHISFHDDIIKWKHFPHHWPLWGDFTSHRWIPLTKASDVELWFFLWSALNKQFSKLSKRQWFDTPSCSL